MSLLLHRCRHRRSSSLRLGKEVLLGSADVGTSLSYDVNKPDVLQLLGGSRATRGAATGQKGMARGQGTTARSP